jgi:predicted nucleic acid-binding protein
VARLEDLRGKKVALDTVVFIYALEGHSEFGDRAKYLLEQIEVGEIKGFACDLVLAELMVKPLRLGKPEIAEEYATDLPQFPNLTFRPVTRDVVIAAARLRGSKNIGLIDALHLASARLSECDAFVTNDVAIQHPAAGLDVFMLSSFDLPRS